MKEKFTSIHHPVAIDRGLGRVSTEDDYARHVEQLMRQVLLTNPGERINRMDFGCGLRRMVFAPSSDVSANLVQVSVLQALETWLSSVVKTEEVKVRAENEKLVVTIRYLLKARQERRYLNVEINL
ncbi:GPW/gp25 family protein [Sorangium sp. So ce1097]|uniref:GPW/gp25 family protein n=1 Tax=Sorangium sp. So ce1097 TaxID=3133330 RepID=UPI003F636020